MEAVASAVYKSLLRVCGGGIHCGSVAAGEASGEWKGQLLAMTQRSVFYSNGAGGSNSERDADAIAGKPHDIEIRILPAIWNRFCCHFGGSDDGRTEKKEKKKRKLPNESSEVEKKRQRLSANSNPTTLTTVENNSKQREVYLISDLGLSRCVTSREELCDLFVPCLDEELRSATIHSVRPTSSCILCVVTTQRERQLRLSGRRPCPLCANWCKGEKGLWWHQQREHGLVHEEAITEASHEEHVNDRAIVPWREAVLAVPKTKDCSEEATGGVNPNKQNTAVAPMEHAKAGNLEEILRLVQGGYDPSGDVDQKGANPLHWAAGQGHLKIVQYLTTDGRCSPHTGQSGRRAFAGRTPLHWAARNGHLEVVRYLVEQCNVAIDATTADGTTAFCWSSWQGHLPVMKYLHSRGCDVHRKNCFGCNAVLWASQGTGGLPVLRWLQSVGCDFSLLNSNGHSVLHKSAQRGLGDVVQWLVQTSHKLPKWCPPDSGTANVSVPMLSSHEVARSNHVDDSSSPSLSLQHVGPDGDGCCPSDLAGMEGHVDLAHWLVDLEGTLASQCYGNLRQERKGSRDSAAETVPGWLEEAVGEAKSSRSNIISDTENLWKSGEAVKRMSRYVANFLKQMDS